MNTSAQYQRLEPWKTGISSGEEVSRNGEQPLISGGDSAVWPPIIARIRDLDKSATSPTPSPSPSPSSDTRLPSKSVRAQISHRRRRNQKISSWFIALVGIIIFVAALSPFLQLRENKISTDVASVAVQPVSATPAPAVPAVPAAPPAAVAPSAPIASPPVSLTGATAPPTDSSGKNSNAASPASPALPITTATPAAIVTANAPLLPSAEKRETPPIATPLPTKASNASAGTPVEQIATQPATVRAGVAAPTTPTANQSTPSQPSTDATSIAVQGEFSKWPPDSVNVEKVMPSPAPQISNALPYAAPANSNAPPMTANQPVVSGAAYPSGMINSPQIPTNPSSPYPQRPAANDPRADARGIYQADARSDYSRRSYNYTPDYRTNPPMNVQNPAMNGQYPASSGQYLPPNARGGAMPPQTPRQYVPSYPTQAGYPNQASYPNQPTPPNYSANRPASPTPSQGTAAGTWQNTGGYPPPAYNNYPSAGATGAAYPGAVNPDGYHLSGDR